MKYQASNLTVGLLTTFFGTMVIALSAISLSLIIACPAHAATIDLTDYSSIDWSKYGKEYTVTNYSKFETCPDRQCINARGRTPRAQGSIACPRALRLGTSVVIGNRPYVCDDRTAARFDGRFDIYVSSYQEAITFGKKKMIVTILP